MRVAVITRRFFRAGGGAEGYAVSLVREMASRHEVHVFSQQSDQPVAGVHYHALAFGFERPRWLNQWVFAISSWWQTRRGFDVVHSHENTWHGDVQTVHVRPLRLNVFQNKSGWRWALQWLKVALSPRLLTYVFLESARFVNQPRRCVVAASGLLQADCAKAYPHASVSVVTPGVHLPEVWCAKETARARLGLSISGACLLFVANDFARKGLPTLLQAMKDLPADTHLVVVGETHQRAAFEATIAQNGLTTRVHFLGRLDDVSLAYQAADVLVHPTLEDSYAMVVAEAMAHGLPVIASAYPWCGMAAELVDGEHAMLLAHPQDSLALKAHVVKLLSDAPLQARLAQAGRAFAQAHDWQHAALKYETIYEHAHVQS